MEIDWNQILANLLMAMLTAAVPILGQAVLALIRQGAKRIEVEIGERNWNLLTSFTRELVNAAEQAIDGAGIDKKDYAMVQLRQFADRLGS